LNLEEKGKKEKKRKEKTRLSLKWICVRDKQPLESLYLSIPFFVGFNYFFMPLTLNNGFLKVIVGNRKRQTFYGQVL
jgi:hypothetical protein